MAFSSSSIGDLGVLGLPRVSISSGETGEAKKLLFLVKEEEEEEGDKSGPALKPTGGPLQPPLLSMISSFRALICLRSCSLNAGRRGGPAGPDPVTGSLTEDESWVAPVSLWTTARKFDGSAWTKVVLGVDEFGSDPLGLLVEEEAIDYERGKWNGNERETEEKRKREEIKAWNEAFFWKARGKKEERKKENVYELVCWVVVLLCVYTEFAL